MSSSVARVLTRTVAAVAAVGLVATGPMATAKPPVRPGTPTDLVVDIGAAPGGGYQLDSTWKSGAHTTTFKVAVTDAVGTVLDSGTVTTVSWHALAQAAAGSTLRVTVTPYNGTRKGPYVAKSVIAPDVTAPTGSFTGTDDAYVGIIHQDALADDVSAVNAIQRTVNWGDGSPVVSWNNGADIKHTYATKGRHLPVVTLVDAAGNQRTIEVPIVIDDHAAPTAAYSLATATGWAKLTPVVLNEDSITDDFSPASAIKRVVAWGDGLESTWTGGPAPTHVYEKAGTFTPQVVVTDETGNAATVVSTTATTITADVAGPTLGLSLPRKRQRPSAASWKLIKGTATDAGVGVTTVSVRAVEKRTRGWYAYVPATKRWVRAGTTQAAAFTRAKPAAATVDAATGRWATPLARLSLGKLVYRVAATDRVGNVAVTLTKTQAITRR